MSDTEKQTAGDGSDSTDLLAELDRLMGSPEVLRYFEVLQLVQENEKKVKIAAPSLPEYMKFRRESLEMDRFEYAEHLGWREGVVKGIEKGAGINLKKAKILFKDGYPPKILFS